MNCEQFIKDLTCEYSYSLNIPHIHTQTRMENERKSNEPEVEKYQVLKGFNYNCYAGKWGLLRASRARDIFDSAFHKG